MSNQPASVWEGAKSPQLCSWTLGEIYPIKLAGVEMTQEDLPYNISPQLASTRVCNSLAFQGCILPSIIGALADADSQHRKLLTVS